MSLPIANTYETFWPRYLACLQQHKGSLAALHRDVISVFADCNTFSPDTMQSPITGMANAIVTELVVSASNTFTAPGCNPLKIKLNDYLKAYVEPLERKCSSRDPFSVFSKFSPLSVWSALETEYGGDTGASIVYSEASKRLVSAFNLHREPPTRVSHGYTSLRLGVWVEERRAEGARLSYNSSDSLRTLCDALHVFAQYAEREDLVQGVAEFRKWSQDWQSCFRSRQQYPLATDLCIVMFQSRFEFRLGSDLTQALQVFVSLYAADMFKEQA